MSYEKKEKIFALWILAAFLCAAAQHYLFAPWGYYRAVPAEEAAARQMLVQAAETYIGVTEADGSHHAIIDAYNSQEILPVGYVMGYEDSWCAAFVTVAAMDAGLTDLIPPECGCQRQIGLFQAMGRWEEWDWTIPQPGDVIYYDWEAPERAEAAGWSDHVGIVVGVKWPFLKVIEGNYEDAVGYRIIPIGHRTIRGYGSPDFGA